MIRMLAVLGAGAGGQAIAAEMSLRGYPVNLFELPEFRGNIEPIKKYGGIAVSGDIVGFPKIDLVTTEIEEAVRDVDMVIIAAQSAGHRTMAEKCLPHLKAGQVISYVGEPGGALEFAQAARERKMEKDITVGETNTLPYRAKSSGPAAVNVILKKGGVLAAAFPGRRTSTLVLSLKELWPIVTSATNVFETILLNFNACDHIPPGLMNVGILEKHGITLYWGDGATAGVAKCIEALSNEIISIRKALGFKNLKPYKDWLFEQGMLDGPKPTTYEAIQASTLAKSVKECRPNILKEDRYIVESLPYGLRLIASIAKLVGVATPVMDAFITIASIVNETNYWKGGRTVDKLGIPTDLDAEMLNKFLHEGKV